jgi:hypothetical protein
VEVSRRLRRRGADDGGHAPGPLFLGELNMLTGQAGVPLGPWCARAGRCWRSPASG